MIDGKLEKSLKCLKERGMMISFGNASGALDPINVPKMLQPKGLFFVRPSMGQYLHTREELDEASKTLFEKIRFMHSDKKRNASKKNK